jgi:hypothetical protein
MPPPDAAAGGCLVVNRTFNTRPVVIHAHGPLNHKPAWPRIREALFAGDPGPSRPLGNLTLLTCNNGHEAMGLFETSVARLGLECVVAGHGIVPWLNSRDKPRTILDALQRIDTEFVLYADSRDAVLLRHPSEAVEQFAAMDGCELLFGGDRINWPALPRFRAFEMNLPGARASEFRYLNGGAWLGRTQYCRRFFEQVVAMPVIAEAPESEQGLLKALLPSTVPQVRMDYRCEIIQNIGFVLADIFDIPHAAAPRA